MARHPLKGRTDLEKENKLTEEDKLKLVPIIAQGLSAHVGMNNIITEQKMLKGLAENMNIHITGLKLKRIIRYIRFHNIVPLVMSSSKGYWVATSVEECLQTINTFYYRFSAEMAMMYKLIEQTTERYGVTIDEDEEAQEMVVV